MIGELYALTMHRHMWMWLSRDPARTKRKYFRLYNNHDDEFLAEDCYLCACCEDGKCDWIGILDTCPIYPCMDEIFGLYWGWSHPETRCQDGQDIGVFRRDMAYLIATSVDSCIERVMAEIEGRV